MERAWVLSGRENIDPELIEPWLQNSRPGDNFSARPGCLLEDMEREMILKTLNQIADHRAKTAKALGIGLRTLGLKLKRWQEQGNSLLAS
jgi:two-component system, NtrC family, response regulator HydG